MRVPEFRIAAALLCFAFGTTTHSAPICTGNCSIGTEVSVGSFNGGNGSLSVFGGDVVAAGGAGFIGSFGSNAGTATVSGNGSRMDIGGTSNSQLFVGTDGGTGILSISNNGTVTANAFNNAPNFGDARAHVGRGGVGTVTINSGGSLIVRDLGPFGSDDGIQLGSSAGASPGTGTINVDGTGSLVVRGNLAFINVGQANTLFSGPAPGTGFLNVTNGAKVLIDGTSGTGLLSIGRGGNSSGNVLVSGVGSRIDLTGQATQIFVANDLTGGTGNSGVGVLRVTQGAVVATQAVTPGTSLNVGFGIGSGLVIVDNGGTMNLDGAIRISRNSATHNTQTGTLLINGTGVVNAANTFVGNGTNAAINGILAGTGTLRSPVIVQTGGLVDPGVSPGTLTIDGDVLFDGGALRIEVGGLNSGEFDILNVLGQVTFTSGLINFAFIDGFAPTTGDTFNFLLADEILGITNATLNYSGLASGFLFDVAAFDGGLSFLALNDGVRVPEPSSLALVALGIFGFAAARRRRR